MTRIASDPSGILPQYRRPLLPEGELDHIYRVEAKYGRDVAMRYAVTAVAIRRVMGGVLPELTHEQEELIADRMLQQTRLSAREAALHLATADHVFRVFNICADLYQDDATAEEVMGVYALMCWPWLPTSLLILNREFLKLAAKRGLSEDDLRGQILEEPLKWATDSEVNEWVNLADTLAKCFRQPFPTEEVIRIGSGVLPGAYLQGRSRIQGRRRPGPDRENWPRIRCLGIGLLMRHPVEEKEAIGVWNRLCASGLRPEMKRLGDYTQAAYGRDRSRLQRELRELELLPTS